MKQESIVSGGYRISQPQSVGGDTSGQSPNGTRGELNLD